MSIFHKDGTVTYYREGHAGTWWRELYDRGVAQGKWVGRNLAGEVSKHFRLKRQLQAWFKEQFRGNS